MEVLMKVLCFLLFLVLTGTLSATEYGRSKVQFGNDEWWEMQAQHFTIYFPMGAEAAAETLLIHTERELLSLSERFDYMPDEKIPIILYMSPTEFRQTDISPYEISPGVGGFTEYFKGRVVIPFTGYWSEFRHVVAHELSHAFVFDMLYRRDLLNVIRANTPLWVSEGLAEYTSLGWDRASEAEFRDMVIADGIVSIQDLSRRRDYIVYRQGQAVCHFMVQRYGDEVLQDFVLHMRGSGDVESAVKAALRMTVAQFNQKFQEWARETYWAELASRESPSDIGNAIYNDDERISQTATTISNDGGLIAGVEYHHAHLAVTVRSSLTGELISRPFVSGGLMDLAVSPMYGVCSFSPGGDSIAVAYQHVSGDRIRICHDGEEIDLPFSMDLIRDPAWSPDGGAIAFIGMVNTRLDLYYYDLEQGLVQVTDDYLGQREPSWSGSSILTSVEQANGSYSLTSYALDGESKDILSIPAEIRHPQEVPGGVMFLSDMDDYPDLYLLDMETGDIHRLTALYRSIEYPSWASASDILTFVSSDWNGGGVFLAYDLPERRACPVGSQCLEVTYNTDAPTRAAGMSALIEEGPQSRDPGDPPGTGLPRGQRPTGGTMPGDTSGTTVVEVSLDSLARSISPYSPGLSVDYASAMAAYDSYLGLAGYTEVVFSDILAHHRVILNANLNGGSLSDADVGLYYSYLPNQLDLGLGFYRQSYRYLFRFSDGHREEVRDVDLGGFGFTSLPFSPSFRVEGGLGYRNLTRRGIWNSNADFEENILTVNAGAVIDNALWGSVGPRVGTRLSASVEYAPDILGSASYGLIGLDFRHYTWVSGQVTLATRLAGGASWGDDAPVFFLGGAMPHRRQWGEVDSIDQLMGFYSNYGDLLRGFDYTDISGRRYSVFSTEMRVPFIDVLSLQAPLPMTLYNGRGVFFIDIGTAFDDFESFRGASTAGGYHLNDLKMGIGLGYRMNLGYFLLKHDVAWRTDLRGISRKPVGYVTLGAEF